MKKLVKNNGVWNYKKRKISNVNVKKILYKYLLDNEYTMEIDVNEYNLKVYVSVADNNIVVFSCGKIPKPIRVLSSNYDDFNKLMEQWEKVVDYKYLYIDDDTETLKFKNNF